MALLEIACFSADSAIIAWKAGAGRLELCDDEQSGGVTPSANTIQTVKAQVDVPVFVMIRPRGGNFVYADAEFDWMKARIDEHKSTVDGFVFGVLDKHQRVHVDRTKELVRRAHPLKCTFHRAIDETVDILLAVEDIIACGCHAILSSGGAPNALSGSDMLRLMVERAQDRVTIIPGGGVRAGNLNVIRQTSRASVFHSSALVNGSSEPQVSEIHELLELLKNDTKN